MAMAEVSYKFYEIEKDITRISLFLDENLLFYILS